MLGTLQRDDPDGHGIGMPTLAEARQDPRGELGVGRGNILAFDEGKSPGVTDRVQVSELFAVAFEEAVFAILAGYGRWHV